MTSVALTPSPPTRPSSVSLTGVYRKHNFRKFTPEGRAIMLVDLEEMHATMLGTYKALMLLSGVDLDELAKQSFYVPTERLPI